MLNIEVDKLDLKNGHPPSQTYRARRWECRQWLIEAFLSSVIVRSSVNIHVGWNKKNQRSSTGFLGPFSRSLYHLPELHHSPAWLPLLMTGWKLANPKLFRSLWKMGPRQFAPFIITLVAIVLTDLLLGVIIGMIVSLLFVMASTVWNPLATTSRVFRDEVVLDDDPIRLILAQHVSFLSRLKIKNVLNAIEPNSTVIVDGSQNVFIDEDTLELIADYVKESAGEGIKASVEGLDLPEQSTGLH